MPYFLSLQYALQNILQVLLIIFFGLWSKQPDKILPWTKKFAVATWSERSTSFQTSAWTQN